MKEYSEIGTEEMLEWAKANGLSMSRGEADQIITDNNTDIDLDSWFDNNGVDPIGEYENLSKRMRAKIQEIISSLDDKKEKEALESDDREETDTLDVYIVGDAVHTYSESDEEKGVFYTTFMALGEYFGTPVEFGSEGFMYHNAIERYQEETGKKINLHWFQWPEHLEEELKENGQADVIISTFTSVNDYYLYMNQEMFYDLSLLFEQNEIYTSEKYYNHYKEVIQMKKNKRKKKK